jgi:hypothetical protein
MEPTVRDVPEAKRYEIRDGEQLLGHTDYERRGDTLLFTHTETWSQHLGTEPAVGSCGQSTCWPYISPSGSAISSMRAPSGSRK